MSRRELDTFFFGTAMVQSHCKIKGSLSLPPIGRFITNIALSRKV
jgi:hypothetical protein